MFRRTLTCWAAREFGKVHSRKRVSLIKRSYSVSSKLVRLPELDLEYLINPANRKIIEDNIKKRKSPNNLDRVIELYDQFKAESNPSKKDKLFESLTQAASTIPNATHPDVWEHPDEPKKIKSWGSVEHSFRAKQFHELAGDLGLFRMEHLTTLTGRRSYFFVGDLADLEHALIKYALSKLIHMNFKLISVPDILPGHIIEGCGMSTKGERTQVFQLDDCHGQDMFLSGTAEMGLAALYANTVIDVNDLPLLVTSVSRCHRAELSTVKEEQGLFRVHHFTKVEMFGFTHPSRSEELFQTFVDIQDEIFTSLGLDFCILQMPISDLGAPAHRKFDIEAWFPGRGIYGELSSCSNCTDYQARRLNIKYRDGDALRHVHTVNGTACAIPRTAMAIFETHQKEGGSIVLPEPLRVYMDGRTEIRKELAPRVGEKTEESRSL